MSTWFLPFFHISGSSEDGVCLSNMLQLLSLLTQCYHLSVAQHCSVFPHMQCYTRDWSFPSSSLFLLWSWGSSSDLCACKANVLPLSSGSRQSWLSWHRNDDEQMMFLLQTLQWFATVLSPQSELLPMDSWIWKSVLFFLTECWDFSLLKTVFAHSPLSFLIMSCFSQLNSLWACSFSITIFFSIYVQPLLFKKQKSKPLPTPLHKSISSSDISSRSTFDYLP